MKTVSRDHHDGQAPHNAHARRNGHGFIPPQAPSRRDRFQQVLQSPLPHRCKALLMALLAWARADLTVYHGQRALAAELGYDPSYIRIIRAELIQQGILEVSEAPRRGRVTGYTIHLDRLPEGTTTPTPAGRNGRSLQPQVGSHSSGTVYQSMGPATPTKGDRVAPMQETEEAIPLLHGDDSLAPIVPHQRHIRH